MTVGMESITRDFLDIAESRRIAINTARKNEENSTYAAWTKDPKSQEILTRLHELLEQHAQCLMLTILRHEDLPLREEAVNRVLLSLPRFKGRCAFTTWAHGVLSNVFYDQRRALRRRKEFSLETDDQNSHFFVDRNDAIGTSDLVRTVKQSLTKTEYLLFDLLMLQGKTQREVAESLKVPQKTISNRWIAITRKLQDVLRK